MAKKSAGRRKSSPSKAGKWSAEVNRTSDALELEDEVFKKRNPTEVAKSLKASAEKSERRKSSPFRSAMSMLTFYMNRAGSNLTASRARVLDRAKDELRKLYARPTAKQESDKGKANSERKRAGHSGQSAGKRSS